MCVCISLSLSNPTNGIEHTQEWAWPRQLWAVYLYSYIWSYMYEFVWDFLGPHCCLRFCRARLAGCIQREPATQKSLNWAEKYQQTDQWVHDGGMMVAWWFMRLFAMLLSDIWWFFMFFPRGFLPIFCEAWSSASFKVLKAGTCAARCAAPWEVAGPWLRWR